MKGMSLSTVRIRRIWPNMKSEKNQVTVQFAQKLQNGTGNGLVALAQGAKFETIVTALFSFSATEAEKYFGTTEIDNSGLSFDQWPEASAFELAAGEPLAISVIENTTQNPNTSDQQPKINPNGREILTSGGAPIYRHTELATASTVRREFLQHDQAVANSAPVQRNALHTDAIPV